MKRALLTLLLVVLFAQCRKAGNESESTDTAAATEEKEKTPFSWRNATIYFLLTDRFNNGDKSNDVNFDRTGKAAKLRGFEGGDIKGVTRKIKDGYFDTLGVTAIWLTPLVEQVHGGTNEGTGFTYGYHGYWAKDWTALDPNFGTEQDLKELVDNAHGHGIRVVLDVVVNHTGPVTPKDPAYPKDWVRLDPVCNFRTLETTTKCTLVKNLPDILTESDQPVELPDLLKQKWQQEGRLEQEMQELDAFFQATGYPRAARFYVIKWLTESIRKFGIDGFRVDTAFNDWKGENPARKLDDNEFFMVAEVYGYSAGNGRAYPYDDGQKVDFYANGFESMINFAFKHDARGSYDQLFTKYDTVLHGGSLEGLGVLNYLTSHDDGNPLTRTESRRLRPVQSCCFPAVPPRSTTVTKRPGRW